MDLILSPRSRVEKNRAVRPSGGFRWIRGKSRGADNAAETLRSITEDLKCERTLYMYYEDIQR